MCEHPSTSIISERATKSHKSHRKKNGAYTCIFKLSRQQCAKFFSRNFQRAKLIPTCAWRQTKRVYSKTRKKINPTKILVWNFTKIPYLVSGICISGKKQVRQACYSSYLMGYYSWEIRPRRYRNCFRQRRDGTQREESREAAPNEQRPSGIANPRSCIR